MYGLQLSAQHGDQLVENAIGLYWRLEEGGLLFGMSNPDEAPGKARRSTGRTCTRWRERMHRLRPGREGLGIRKAWAATIEYMPDHLPIVGPVFTRTGDGSPACRSPPRSVTG